MPQMCPPPASTVDRKRRVFRHQMWVFVFYPKDQKQNWIFSILKNHAILYKYFLVARIDLGKFTTYVILQYKFYIYKPLRPKLPCINYHLLNRFPPMQLFYMLQTCKSDILIINNASQLRKIWRDLYRFWL